MSKRNQRISRQPAASVASPAPDWELFVAPLAIVLLVILGFVQWSGNRKLQDEWMRKQAIFDDLTSRLGPAPAPKPPAGQAPAPQVPAAAAAAAAPSEPVPDIKTYTVSGENAPSKGLATAPITLAVFSDFQCPPCAKVLPTIERVRQVYGDQLRFLWKNCPLPEHKDAPIVHRAAIAAQQQGKFWEYHDKLFATDPKKLERELLLQLARELKLDIPRFEQDLASEQTQKRLDADLHEAESLQVHATPVFFVNGRFFTGAQPYDEFIKVINAELERLELPIPPGAQVIGPTPGS